jgi:hypothetical protein
MVSFDTQLIERLQRYWKSRTGEDISIETSVEYLNAFADLYESFIDFANPKYDKRVVDAVEGDDHIGLKADVASPDMISPHSCKSSFKQ